MKKLIILIFLFFWIINTSFADTTVRTWYDVSCSYTDNYMIINDYANTYASVYQNWIWHTVLTSPVYQKWFSNIYDWKFFFWEKLYNLDWTIDTDYSTNLDIWAQNYRWFYDWTYYYYNTGWGANLKRFELATQTITDLWVPVYYDIIWDFNWHLYITYKTTLWVAEYNISTAWITQLNTWDIKVVWVWDWQIVTTDTITDDIIRYDLSVWVWISNPFNLRTNETNPTHWCISNNWTDIYYVENANSVQYWDVTGLLDPIVFWPPVLDTVWVWSQTDTVDWVSFNFECNADCVIDYEIKYEFDENLDPTKFYIWSLWSFSWSVDLFTWSILHWSDFFKVYHDYIIDFTFTDINDNQVTFELSQNVYYDYEWIEVVIDENSFDVTFDDWYFYPNGFWLNNLDSTPKGWQIWFHITWPNESWTGTVDLLAWPYFHKSYSPNYWYWQDTVLDVTRWYHEYAWNYNVYMEYKYLDFTIYPFGTGWLNYFISEPELFYEPISLHDKCNNPETDTGVIPGVSNFFWCSVSLVAKWVENIDEAYDSIKTLFQTIWNIWNTQQTKQLFEAFNFDWELIPSANASTWTYVYNVEQDPLAIIWQWSFEDIPLLNNVYNLIKYVILSIVVFWLLVYFFKPREDG